MTLTQVSTGGIKDGQVQTADLADGQVTVGKLHADALDHTYTLGADGSNHYTFTGEGLTGAVNDPTLYLTRGKTYRFVNGNSAGAHPFRIQTTVNGSAGTEYNTGVTNNGGAGGSTIIFEVPHAAPDVLYYQCTSHGSMGGILYVTGALADGTVTTAKLAADAVDGTKLADNAVNSEHITDQAVTLAKLPHGTSSNDGKFLRANNGADPTFETVSGTTINNNADNRVITGSATANTLEAESSVVIDSSSRLLVGKTASKPSDGENTAKAQIESTGNCMLDIAANGTTSSSYAGLNLIRSDGSSVNDHTAVDSGDRIARINFIGADGSDRFNACASIRAFAADDFSANNCPGFLTFLTNSGSAAPSERIRIDKDGKVGINEISPTKKLQVTSTTSNDGLMLKSGSSNYLTYAGNTNRTTEGQTLLRIESQWNGTAVGRISFLAGSDTTNKDDGQIRFSTASGGTMAEAMRIKQDGVKSFGAFSGYNGGHNIFSGAASTSDFCARFDGVGSGSGNFIQFVNAYGQMGAITYNAGTTYYNTSSDYRLKENDVSISNGIARVKQLRPIRFNWKANKDLTVDGFIAHEVTPVVPEAVVGEKDATQTTYYGGSDTIPEGKKEGDVKEENAILPQQLDASKLIPVLTAALQEAIAKIETLEAKVAVLEFR